MSHRVLVYVEPCIFRDDPGFLRGHLDCFVNPVLRALSLETQLPFLGFASNIFLALSGLNSARGLQSAPAETKLYPLYNGDILAGFDHCLEAYSADLFYTGDARPLEPGLVTRIRSIIDDAKADIVITTSQNRYLTALSQSLGFTLISLEFGPLPRLPFPANRFIALDGHLSEGAFASPEALQQAMHGINESGVSQSIQAFEASYIAAVSEHPQYAAIRQQIQALRSTSTVSLLALQPEQWLTWEGALGKRRSAQSIILEALDQLHTDKLIVTFHQDKRGLLNPATLREVWLSDPRLELLPEELSMGLSELFLPFVDELITVSSNLAMSAFLLGKPVTAIGQSFARTLQRLAAECDQADGLLVRDKVFRFLMERMSVDDASFSDPRALYQRLDRLFQQKASTTLRPGNDFNGVLQHADLAPGHDIRTADLRLIHSHLAVSHDGDAPPGAMLRTYGRHALGHLLAPGAVGAEFGVARGFFSESLLRSGRFARLYSIDKWNDHHNDEEYAFVRERLAPFGAASEILRMSFESAQDAIEDRSLDFLYVDGYAHTGHDASVVRQCLSKLKPGALVAAHDFDRFSWPVNHRKLSELFYGEGFTDQQTIPAVLTSNDEDMFPGIVARYIG